MENLEAALKKFIKKDDPRRVFAVKGEWGVGKTFFWKEFSKNLSPELAPNGSHYGSAFGAEDIGQLTSLLASDVLLRDSTDKIKSLSKKTLSIGRRWSPLISFSHLGNTQPLNKFVESKLLKDSLVCIDDLERSRIPMDDILGLVSRLTEELGSKVVLLFNEDEIQNASKSTFVRYREKAIDSEFTFNPTVEENLQLVWKGAPPPDVLELFELLECSNIRVMMRVDWIRNLVTELLAGIPKALLDRTLRNATVLACIHYIANIDFSAKDAFRRNPFDRIPELELEGEPEAGEENEERKRFVILDRLSYRPFDLDLLTLKILHNGYANKDDFKEQISAELSNQSNSEALARLEEIWRKYRNNFRYLEADFMRDLEALMRNEHEKINPTDVFYAIDFLTSLGSNEDLDNARRKAVERYVDKHSDGRFAEFHARTGSLPKGVWDEIQKEIERREGRRPLGQLVKDIGDGNHPTVNQIIALNTPSEDEYYEWLKTTDQENLFSILASFLQLHPTAEADQWAEVRTKIEGALRRLKKRSTMDRIKIEKGLEL